jgi:hypothetical protein
MRYHDIMRLKEAAKRYRDAATCLGDIEELVDYAIDKLDDEPAPIAWIPPASLSSGEYKWNGSHFTKFGEAFCISKSGGIPVMFRDWIDPPKPGRYKVENGNATWLGE